MSKSMWRYFDFAVVALILVLAVMMGVLNNLRVAEERMVKWFDDSAGRNDPETKDEVMP